MNANEQIFAFAEDLDKLVERYRNEFDITYAAVVGVLFMKAQILCSESAEEEE